jgi:hypothetical protein
MIPRVKPIGEIILLAADLPKIVGTRVGLRTLTQNDFIDLAALVVLVWIDGACARETAPPPELGASPLATDAGASLEPSTDPFAGNPPPEPRDAGPSAHPKCTHEKSEGWGSSGSSSGSSSGTGCGGMLAYRCGGVSYEIACSHGPRGADCECKENGRVTRVLQQPKERCGNATDAAEVCGFPRP